MGRIFTLLVIVYLLHIQLFAQTSSKYLSKEEALTAIDWFLNMIDSIHPCMYYYTPKDMVDATFNNLRKECKVEQGDSISSEWLLAKLEQCDHLWDSHTGVCKTESIGDASEGRFYKTDRIFPPIRWSDKGEAFLLGSDNQISSINNIPIDTIMSYMFLYEGRDESIVGRYVIWTNTRLVSRCLDQHNI